MPAKHKLIAAAALAFAFVAPTHAQDSPSLGDIARQAQKDKEKDKAGKPAARVLTNDDLPSSGGMQASLGSGLGQLTSASSSSARTGSTLSPLEKLAAVESSLNQLDSVDRATFIRGILAEHDVPFPGRAKWEDRMYSEKVAYVKQSRELVSRAKQLIGSVESMKASGSPDPAQQKEIGVSVGSIMRDAVKMDAEFQAVMMEGRDLATQASQR